MWFYRYLIRGLGLVLIVGMITILVLAVCSRRARSHSDRLIRMRQNERIAKVPDCDIRVNRGHSFDDRRIS